MGDSPRPCHNRPLSRAPDFRGKLTRVSHLVVWILRKHCNGAVWQQPAHSPWHLSVATFAQAQDWEDDHRCYAAFVSATEVCASRWLTRLTGLPRHVHSNSRFPQVKACVTAACDKMCCTKFHPESSGSVAPCDDRVSQDKCPRVFLSTRRVWCDD